MRAPTTLFVFLFVAYVVADTTATGGPSIRNSKKLPGTVDYIVLGGGTAGSVVASRLSEDSGNKVLVIEAGTDYHGVELTEDPSNWQKTTGSQLDWNDIVKAGEPKVNMDLTKRHITQGRVLGGCSAINSAMYVRSDPYNFNQWAANGNPGWAYQDVLPFFKKAETSTRYSTNPAYHGNSGPLRVGQGYQTRPADTLLIQAAQNAGLTYVDDWNGAAQITSSLGSVGYHEFSINNFTRQNAWESFLRPNIGRRNLWVFDSSVALKINFQGNKAVSVDWVDHLTGETSTTRARKEVVVSLGTMRSAQLLKISGVGNATELQQLGIDVVKNLPGVGKNVQDHPVATFSVAAPSLAACPAANRSLSTRVNFWIRTKYQDANDPRPDIQVHSLTPCPSIFVLLYLLHPKSRGEITISSRDPTERPQPAMNYFSDSQNHDINTMIEGIRRTLQILGQSPINGTISTALNVSNDAAVSSYIMGSGWTISNTNSGNHLVGSCKMGPSSDPLAVVDSRLRVHGLDNLRVIDASIMPEITSGNTQAPTYMIAEKGAYMILQDN